MRRLIARQEAIVFTVTQDATEAVRAAIEAVKAPDSAGLRISLAPQHLNGSGPAIAVELVEAPGKEDEILLNEGGRFFLAPGAAAALEDKMLDAEIAPEGEIRFGIVDQG
jgi:iron-sulfur cluster assembly protein